ncbi:MAG TPA: hypothetical protein VL242_29355 [Sorangium sp.]|uniref:coproporphyrinogen III oxidase n=1 Tax=Sorangium sp. So ce1153 TaxID=3133333 RepID=UPI002C9BDA70|nr:hypothetical protein [Sorangium sp.]
MAGLDHDFFLLDRAEHPFTAYGDFAGSSGAIQIHDDLVQYMTDALRWIPSLNPARKRRGFGLNIHGPTIITDAGAPIARRIFESWERLFSSSPPMLRLTGAWCETVGSPGTGRYLKLTYRRDDAVTRLRGLASLCRRVERGGGQRYLLHMGI